MKDKTHNILIVQESPAQSEHLRKILEEEGWRVSCSSSGHHALRHISEYAPDLVLVDYHLPDLEGNEFCRQIRMRIDMRVIPVIILTVENEFDIETAGIESGADDFVAKSADTRYLVLRVKTLLSRATRYQSLVAPTQAHDCETRVLAIDDSATYLAYLRQSLAKEAYQLETASSGAEGLAKLAEGDFACVIVDWMMHEMNGLEVCSRINELRTQGALGPMILMLTGKEDRESMEQALEAGADDFVGKSADIAVAKVRVRALLRRRFYEEENHRIIEQLRQREIEVERSRMEKAAAEARAALVDDLERSNTELVQTKQELERTVSRLYFINQQLEEFAYLSAHHLQEPSRQLITLSDLLRQDLGESLPERAVNDLQWLCAKAKRMQKLVAALSELSAIGRSPEPPGLVSLNDCADQAIRCLATHIEETGAQITRDELPEVPGHADEIVKLYQCLIGNALTFVSADRIPVIQLAAERGAAGWVLSVRDNGIGIPPQSTERVFAPFTRLHHESEYEGLGIGLSLCRKIMDLHGGRIQIESVPGSETTVSFTFPDTTVYSNSNVRAEHRSSQAELQTQC